VLVCLDVMTLVVVVEAVEVDEEVVEVLEVLVPTEFVVVVPTCAAIGSTIASAKASVTRAIVPKAFIVTIAHRWCYALKEY